MKLTATKKDAEKIQLIAKRMFNTMNAHGASVDLAATTFAITACHLNGCPLDLDTLLTADDFNLLHDVGGISKHLNANTGRLENCFVPRCAAPRKRRHVRRPREVARA